MGKPEEDARGERTSLAGLDINSGIQQETQGQVARGLEAQATIDRRTRWERAEGLSGLTKELKLIASKLREDIDYEISRSKRSSPTLIRKPLRSLSFSLRNPLTSVNVEQRFKQTLGWDAIKAKIKEMNDSLKNIELVPILSHDKSGLTFSVDYRPKQAAPAEASTGDAENDDDHLED